MKRISKYLLLSLFIFSPFLKSETIDLLVFYTSDFYPRSAFDKISHLIENSNMAYKNSDLDLKIKLAHMQKVDYPSTNTSNQSLHDLRSAKEQFYNVDALRKKYGADMVVLFAPFSLSNADQACGLASLSTNIRHINKSDMFSFVRVGADQGIYCSDLTLAHELGHNMGLTHSDRQGGQGIMDDAKGHGVDYRFVTIMPYSSYFGGAPELPLFSTPKKTCTNPKDELDKYQCGIQNESNAVRVMKITSQKISQLYPTVNKPTVDKPNPSSETIQSLISSSENNEGSNTSGGSLGGMLCMLIFVLIGRLISLGK